MTGRLTCPCWCPGWFQTQSQSGLNERKSRFRFRCHCPLLLNPCFHLNPFHLNPCFHLYPWPYFSINSTIRSNIRSLSELNNPTTERTQQSDHWTDSTIRSLSRLNNEITEQTKQSDHWTDSTIRSLSRLNNQIAEQTQQSDRWTDSTIRSLSRRNSQIAEKIPQSDQQSDHGFANHQTIQAESDIRLKCHTHPDGPALDRVCPLAERAAEFGTAAGPPRTADLYLL